MGYDPSTCNTKLSQAGLVPSCEVLTNPAKYHCNDLEQISPVVHAFCGQMGQYYAPVQALLCIHHTGQTPDSWVYFPPEKLYEGCHAKGAGWWVENCYCCCSCFAYDTMIAVPGGTEPIQFIPVGSNVLTAAVAGGGKLRFDWAPTEVTFSSGVAGGDNAFMVYLAHEHGDIICTPDQVFMLASGKLTTANRLAPGDSLVDKDGAAVPVHTVSIGDYKGGVHHIGTDGRFHGEIDGHLLLAAGVVVGDYMLQMNFDSIDDKQKAQDHDARPEIGTAEYASARKTLRAATARVMFTQRVGGPNANQVQLHSGKFKFYTEGGVDLGVNVASLFPDAQAEYLLENVDQIPLSNPIPKTEINHIFAVLRGFFPGYIFYLDWYKMKPNVYAFEEYGQKFIVVTGGMARMPGMSYEGLAMAVAHGLGRFLGGTPKDLSGFTVTGAADYYGFGVVSRTMWYGNSWIRSATSAFEQTQQLFERIKVGVDGDPNNPVGNPSIACRLGAIQSGLAGGALPTCAGGPPPVLIGLEVATPEFGGVALTLSIAPTPDGAVDIANYTFDPPAKVTAAQVDKAKNFIIHVAADLTAGTKYTVTIANMITMVGDGVDPDRNSATFTAA